MVFVLLLAILLFPLSSEGLSLSDALLFISSVERKEFCSEDFLKLQKTDIGQLVVLLYIDSCSSSKGVGEPKNPYGKLKLASLLKSEGKKEKAKKLYFKVFSSTNRLDEEVLLANRGVSSYLFRPQVLRKKVWMAAREKEIGTALFYLSFLRDDPYYTYLLAYTLMRWGKREAAKRLFKASLPNERFFFLMLLSESLTGKLHYYIEFMESSAKRSFKRRATVYILDRLLLKDLGLFRKAIGYAGAFPDLYSYYMARYYALTGRCREIRKLKIKTEAVRAVESVCLGKRWKGSEVDFYTLLLNPPDSFPFKRERIFGDLKLKDRGLNLLYRKGFCSAISFIDRPSPQNALAHYLCGNYKKGIKLSAPFRRKLDKFPYLLPVLYPKPPLFGDDLISLSIARQESLFDGRALSRSGAIGLMQIMPLTGRDIARRLKVDNFKVYKLYDPTVNYRFGSYYIHRLVERFKLFPLAAAAYNCGPGRVEKALKLFGSVETPKDLLLFTELYLPFEETRDYVKKTYVNLYYYSNLYGEGKEWKLFEKFR